MPAGDNFPRDWRGCRAALGAHACRPLRVPFGAGNPDADCEHVSGGESEDIGAGEAGAVGEPVCGRICVVSRLIVSVSTDSRSSKGDLSIRFFPLTIKESSSKLK